VAVLEMGQPPLDHLGFMTTHDDLAVAAWHSVDPARWLRSLDELMIAVGPRFCRVEPRRRARAFVLGLLADLPRKNCWSIAEHAGDRGPEGMQYLLGRARWDADAVRDDVRGYVTGHLGDPGAVLVADETGDLKKGACTAGVQRQYSGTAGRIENCQVAVYLTYAAPRGHALIDRELYLPASWIADPQRCRSAGIPSGTAFATKPALARRMIARALDAGAPASWVAGDEVYGTDPGLRSDLENRGMGYVLAVARSHYVQTSAGNRRADQAASEVPRSAWQRCSAGAGAHGHRYYDWAWITITPGRAGCRWLLIRRHPRTGELAFYRCYSPRPVPLAALIQVAGRRWTVEEDFQSAKGLTGLDEHQVRRWGSWHRWVTLAMLAAAFLAITAAGHARQPPPQGQIPLTRNEIARLLATPHLPQPAIEHRLRWSAWRRRHQHRARTSHYQRQARQP
jgi:SRSO17 transposase